MPPRSDRKCCIEAEKAIRHAHLNHVPSISHTCHIKGRPKVDLIPGHRLTDYCSAVLQGTGIAPLMLVPTQQYAVCREMLYAFIDPVLRAITNNAADPPGGGVIMLPRTATIKQETSLAGAEIAASTGMANDRIMIHDHFTNINNNNSSTATARASTATDTVAAPPGGGVTAAAADPSAALMNFEEN